jgi:hypothetical protein
MDPKARPLVLSESFMLGIGPSFSFAAYWPARRLAAKRDRRQDLTRRYAHAARKL